MAQDNNGNKNGSKGSTNSKGVTTTQVVPLVVTNGVVEPDHTSGVVNR